MLLHTLNVLLCVDMIYGMVIIFLSVEVAALEHYHISLSYINEYSLGLPLRLSPSPSPFLRLSLSANALQVH